MEHKAKIYLYKKPIVTQNISWPIFSTKLILIFMLGIQKKLTENHKEHKKPSISIPFVKYI